MSVIKGTTSSNTAVDVRVDDQGRLVISNPGSGGEGGSASEETLASIATLITNRLPATLDGGRFRVNVQNPITALIDSSTPVNVTFSGATPLPTGAATEATLLEVRNRLPSVLGRNLEADSLSVILSDDQPTIPVSVASIGLPTGAATEATLAAINAKIPALGQTTMSGSLPVVLASNQSNVNVAVQSSALPTGAATEATLQALNARGAQLAAASLSVVLASNQAAVPITSAAGIGQNADAAATTDIGTFNLIQLIKRLLSVTLAKGQQTMAASLPVAIASNQSAIPVTGTFTAPPISYGFGATDATTTRVVTSDDSVLGAVSNAEAASDTANSSIMSYFKRLLNTKLQLDWGLPETSLRTIPPRTHEIFPGTPGFLSAVLEIDDSLPGANAEFSYNNTNYGRTGYVSFQFVAKSDTFPSELGFIIFSRNSTLTSGMASTSFVLADVGDAVTLPAPCEYNANITFRVALFDLKTGGTPAPAGLNAGETAQLHSCWQFLD